MSTECRMQIEAKSDDFLTATKKLYSFKKIQTITTEITKPNLLTFHANT